MSEILTHSPADVLRRLLVDTIGMGPVGNPSPVTMPSDAGTWPIFVGNEPDRPDNVVTVYDTAGIIDARSMIDGEVFEHHGVQLRIRDATYDDGYRQARVLANALDELIILNEVIMTFSTTTGGTTATGTATYTVHSVSRKSGPISIGKEKAKSKRTLFTINALICLKQDSVSYDDLG